jgi:hypothetical protein
MNKDWIRLLPQRMCGRSGHRGRRLGAGTSGKSYRDEPPWRTGRPGDGWSGSLVKPRLGADTLRQSSGDRVGSDPIKSEDWIQVLCKGQRMRTPRPTKTQCTYSQWPAGAVHRVCRRLGALSSGALRRPREPFFSLLHALPSAADGTGYRHGAAESTMLETIHGSRAIPPEASRSSLNWAVWRKLQKTA